MNKRVFIILAVVILVAIATSVGVSLYGKKLPPKNYIIPSLRGFSTASGVVPHHLVAKEIIENFFQYILLKEEPRDIILLGPDHFNTASIVGKIFTSVDAGTKEFHDLAVNNFLLQKLDGSDLAFDNSAVNLDHGITTLLPYIKKYFPKSRVLPIVISSTASKEDVEKLINTINNYAGPQTIVVASVDFSHYLPPKAADFHDVKSIATLIDFKENDFKDLEVDSWQALYGARFFAKLKGKEFPNNIRHGKSSDFLKFDDSVDTEGVTSYFSVVFEGKNSQETVQKGKAILLVGDIMLDRGVESLIVKNSVIYPFQKIGQFLRGVDIVIGNLEGPIVKEPQNFPADSLTFNFLPRSADGLSWANFNLLSLANNHTINGGETGLEETRYFLKEKSIDFVGDPLKCTEKYSFKKDGVTVLAFNKTFPSSCSDEELIDTIKLFKPSNPESFLIIIMHWGEEYQKINSVSQRELAHKIIEAGADTVVGHHPHVVQNIELYKNKLIFYSLGNFVFDQYFSKDVQEGLGVGIEVYDSKIRCRLFPLQSGLSQPSLMAQNDANKFLEDLAARSSSAILDKVKNGILEIDRLAKL